MWSEFEQDALQMNIVGIAFKVLDRDWWPVGGIIGPIIALVECRARLAPKSM